MYGSAETSKETEHNTACEQANEDHHLNNLPISHGSVCRNKVRQVPTVFTSPASRFSLETLTIMQKCIKQKLFLAGGGVEDIQLRLKYNIKMKYENMYCGCHNYLFVLLFQILPTNVY